MSGSKQSHRFSWIIGCNYITPVNTQLTIHLLYASLLCTSMNENCFEIEKRNECNWVDDSGSSETNVFLHIGSDSISFHCDICLSWSLTPVLFMVLLHIVSIGAAKWWKVSGSVALTSYIWSQWHHHTVTSRSHWDGWRECEVAGMRISTFKSEAFILSLEMGEVPPSSSSISGSFSLVDGKWDGI